MIKDDNEYRAEALGDGPAVVAAFDHVAMVVTDADEAAQWYRRVFGMIDLDRWEDKAKGMAWVHLGLGALTLEIVQLPGSTARPAGAAGWHHIALKVEDCAAAVASIVASGGTIDREPSYFGRHNIDWAFITDPFGNVWEVFSDRDDQLAAIG